MQKKINTWIFNHNTFVKPLQTLRFNNNNNKKNEPDLQKPVVLQTNTCGNNVSRLYVVISVFGQYVRSVRAPPPPAGLKPLSVMEICKTPPTRWMMRCKPNVSLLLHNAVWLAFVNNQTVSEMIHRVRFHCCFAENVRIA